MLALIAGQGRLPEAVQASQPGRALVCALEHCPPEHLTVDRVFRLETIGSLLNWLADQAVTQVCFCGAVTRPEISADAVDAATKPLVPKVLRALERGDDGALRIIMALFEDKGFHVLAAHEAVPGLLPPEGLWGAKTLPEGAEAAAQMGDSVSQEQSAEDLGQACVVRADLVIAREGKDGTDAMLRALGRGNLPEAAQDRPGALLYKAPKPGQDRRADLPAIGPETVRGAAQAGLGGLVIEAGGVMILDQSQTARALAETGLFLWIRAAPGPSGVASTQGKAR